MDRENSILKFLCSDASCAFRQFSIIIPLLRLDWIYVYPNLAQTHVEEDGFAKLMLFARVIVINYYLLHVCSFLATGLVCISYSDNMSMRLQSGRVLKLDEVVQQGSALDGKAVRTIGK